MTWISLYHDKVRICNSETLVSQNMTQLQWDIINWWRERDIYSSVVGRLGAMGHWIETITVDQLSYFSFHDWCVLSCLSYFSFHDWYVLSCLSYFSFHDWYVLSCLSYFSFHDWYVLSCLWDGAYKRSLGVDWKELLMWWWQLVSSLSLLCHMSDTI